MDDHAVMSQFKRIFSKILQSEKGFVIKKVAIHVPCPIHTPNCEEIIRTFYEKEFQKAIQTKFRVEKVIKKKKSVYDIGSG